MKFTIILEVPDHALPELLEEANVTTKEDLAKILEVQVGSNAAEGCKATVTVE